MNCTYSKSPASANAHIPVVSMFSESACLCLPMSHPLNLSLSLSLSLPPSLRRSTVQPQFNPVNYSTQTPIGVAGLISPWNLPLYLLTFKIAPALAAGNTVVAKPSEMTSVTAWMMCKVFQEAGKCILANPWQTVSLTLMTFFLDFAHFSLICNFCIIIVQNIVYDIIVTSP